VEFPGSVATVGRDPSSDLVLNDAKCSRRHAVIEAGADGITIRDSGSANGVFVNGKKTERSRLRDGDVVKLGDVVLTVLPAGEAGTVVMQDEFEGMPARRGQKVLDAEATTPDLPESELLPAAARRPLTGSFRSAGDRPPDAPAEGPGPFKGSGRPRPLTVTVLVALWALSIPLYLAAPAALAFRVHGAGRAALIVAGLSLAALSGVMAFGLAKGRRWAWILQLAVAAIGVFVCPFSLASIAVLIYMLRPAVQWHFSDRQRPQPESTQQGDAIFAGAVVAAVVFGVLISGALTVLARTARTGAGGRGGRMLVRTPSEERTAATQLTALAAAEEAFHSVCNTGYADLQGLLHPGTVIADYPADGPAFLRGPDYETAEREGYRYTLTVEDEMPPTAGCPTRRFRRFLYSATPLGAGRSLAVGPDGVIHVAEGRPAGLGDPPAE
jgi:ribosome-associated protein YbcJ (S4-like RNA binding protein)